MHARTPKKNGPVYTTMSKIYDTGAFCIHYTLQSSILVCTCIVYRSIILLVYMIYCMVLWRLTACAGPVLLLSWRCFPLDRRQVVKYGRGSFLLSVVGRSTTRCRLVACTKTKERRVNNNIHN